MKRKKKTLFIILFSIQQERGTGREGTLLEMLNQKPKKNGKNERNLKKNLEESFAKASALASPHTRARAQRTDELERHEQETALSVFVVCELRERLC